MSLMLKDVVTKTLDGPPSDPVRRATGGLIRVVTFVLVIVLALVGLVAYKAEHGLTSLWHRHGPHSVNSATIDGKVRLGLPKAASQLMGATAPYNVTVKVDKGWGGNWKYLNGKWGNWNSAGTVGFDVDYSQIQPAADIKTRTETLIMPLPQLLPASIHEAGGFWTYVHCGTAQHLASIFTAGFDHACSIDSGDPNVRRAIDQAVAAQVPANQTAMVQAERGAEQKFGPFVASIIKSVTGQVYTINFVWPSQ